MPDTTSAYTRVKNIAGQTLNFGFLPPHGKTLAADETYDIPGYIHNLFTVGNGRANLRKQAAFEAALLANQLEIIRTPSPVFFDATLLMTKILKVDNAAVLSDNPSYGSYSGSA